MVVPGYQPLPGPQTTWPPGLEQRLRFQQRKPALRSTLIAAGVAAALLVTVVLPAEYNIDPTGIGGALGLAEMGAIKVQLHEEAEADASRRSHEGPRPGRVHRSTLTSSGSRPIRTMRR